MHRLLLFLAGLAAASAFSCKDQNNNDVDWWFAYKMPRVRGDNGVAGLLDGHAFYYLDANKPTFEASQNDLTSSDQAIAHTLAQFYDSKDDPSVFHVLYNDEEAVEQVGIFEKIANISRKVFSSSEYGHTKGVAFFDKTDGVWYVHSVPKFPSTESYGYPDSGRTYGQSMLCMSLGYDQLKSVGTQLFYNHPDIYSSQLPTSMAQDNEDLAQVISGKHKTGIPTTSVIDLKTKQGTTFRSFAKTGDFGKDLYDSLVAPNLQCPLNVETWRRGSVIPLDCAAQFQVLDVQEVKVVDTPEFKYTKDHSKMAVSASSDTPYTCIGDINRMHSQFARGGGTVCLLNADVWNAYSTLVETTNNC
uniref:Deoxyribonuclease II n=1 Tax=Steinernema glaseri TaxID=37863 RepID=A0A1I7YY04_9BILA